MKNSLRRLPLDLKFGEDLIIVNKPAGFSTHAVDPDRPGLAELVEAELLARGKNIKIRVVHRLDKTTTGVLLFATSEARAQQLFESFKQNQVKKRYVLLTETHPEVSEFRVHSKIEKRGKNMLSTPCSESAANALTVFKRVKLNAFFQQWEAFPQTGKTHQIRLHAAQAGIPILGDTLYGGRTYPQLCLHAQAIELPGVGRWESFHPIFFERMGLLRDHPLVGILSALDRRQRLYDFLNQPDICMRLSHLDEKDFRMDLFGQVLWVYWYADHDPSSEDLLRFELIQTLIRRKVLIRKMQNRGQDPLTQKQWTFSEIAPSWHAEENGIQYELRSAQGLSPGLFLDQRENRYWLSQICRDKRVLNLFSYTCGFSVSAALGGAREVISVDLSKTFLDWGKQNLFLNQGVHPKSEASRNLFFNQDSEEFLKQTVKKKKTFDVIVLDPPSFSRNGKNIWKIEKNFPSLLKTAFDCLASGGIMLCCSNFEKWDQEAFRQQIEATLGENLKSICRPPLRCLDFEAPGEVSLMKSFILEKA